MDLDLANKTVLVTGAGQGLGREIGLAFAREGSRVAFHYHHSRTGAEAAAEEARSRGIDALAVGADVTEREALARALHEVRRHLGPIDVLVNNAAMTTRENFLDSGEDSWASQIDVNVIGMLRVTHAVGAAMVASESGGAVVNLMGDSGRAGESGFTVAATTRAAAMGFTKSIAREWARYGIRANCVSLGVVMTERASEHLSGIGEDKLQFVLRSYPARRFGEPSDVIPVVLLLASPRSAWMTGQIVSVNGGYLMP